MAEDGVSPIAWAEILETGIAHLDADHRILIEQCNTLSDLMDRKVPWPEVVEAARRLAKKCGEHFRIEEELLENTEFPRCEQHRQQHRGMESRFESLVDFLADGDGSRAEHLVAARSMRTDLVDILFRHDLDYKSHLQQVAGR